MQGVRALYGAENATLALIAGLRAGGIDVRVIVMDETRLGLRDAPLPAALAARGIPYDEIPVARALDVGLVRGLRRMVAERRIDLLHVLGYKAHLHAALARAAPVVATVHGWLFRADVKERFYGWIEMRLLRRAAAVICLSRFYETYLADHGVPRWRLHRIPNGLERTLLADAPAVPWDGGVRTFGILGRLSDEKNHEMFLRAAVRVTKARPDIRFVIAGDGPLKGRIEARIAELGLGSVVSVRGFVPADSFFRAVDALVLCSRIENLPMSVMEASARGRPVIATAVGGVPDLVVDGETGLLVRSDEDSALAAAMVRLAGDPGLSTRLGAAGRRHMERGFLLEGAVTAHRTLYSGLAAAAHGTGTERIR